MNLPMPEYGANDKETIANLMDTVTKLRKEMEYLLYHLGDSNIPDLAGMKGDIKGNHSLILQAEDQIQLLVTDVAGNTSTINLHANQIALLVTDVEENTSSIIQQAGQIALLVSDVNENTSSIIQNANQIALLVTDVAGHTSTLTVQAGQIQSLVSTTNGHTSSITQLDNEIALKVSNSQYTAGIIVGMINADSYVTIDADKIDLNGVVTMSNLAQVYGTLSVGSPYSSVARVNLGLNCYIMGYGAEFRVFADLTRLYGYVAVTGEVDASDFRVGSVSLLGVNDALNNIVAKFG